MLRKEKKKPLYNSYFQRIEKILIENVPYNFATESEIEKWKTMVMDWEKLVFRRAVSVFLKQVDASKSKNKIDPYQFETKAAKEFYADLQNKKTKSKLNEYQFKQLQDMSIEKIEMFINNLSTALNNLIEDNKKSSASNKEFLKFQNKIYQALREILAELNQSLNLLKVTAKVEVHRAQPH